MSHPDEAVECPTCAGRHPSSVGTCPELEAVLIRNIDGDDVFDTSTRFGSSAACQSDRTMNPP